MRVFLEGSSIDTVPSILTNGISAYVSLAFMIIMTALTIYALVRILDWSSSKPLPSVVQISTFNVLLVSLTVATAALLLVGVDFGQLFGRLGGPILSILEAPDILPVLLVGLASAAMFLVFRWLRTG
jgi:hypothetical protein